MKISVNKMSLSNKRIIAVVLSFMVLAAFTQFTGPDIKAASKTPGKPSISVSVSQNTATIRWGKVKNAKKYQVYRISGTTWVYSKTIKKSKAKKYSNTSKYLLKKKGKKKYKVYVKSPNYVSIATTTSCSHTFKGSYSTSYTFAVRAYNGKKAGKYSAAKTIKTGKKPAPPSDDDEVLHLMSLDSDEAEEPETPTVPAPGNVSNLKAEFKVVDGTNMIYVTWSAASNATSYDVYRKKGTGASATNYPSTPNATKPECKYSLKDVSNNQAYFFKVIAKNKNGVAGQPVEVSIKTPAAQAEPTTPTTPTVGPYSNNPSTAWNQYLTEMLSYYNKELQDNYGVNINSTNKADEFKKLQAIIQVMHDYVGYSERITSDYSNFPTGRANWQYNDTTAAIAGTNTSGNYYNGKDYIPTIKFYGSCDTIAETQEYLAQKAGLDVHLLLYRAYGHKYAMICANNVWYDADPGWYMAPGPKGLGYNSPISDPSSFKEIKGVALSLSKYGTSPCPVQNVFTFGNTVFYGSSKSVSDTGGLTFVSDFGDIGINPANATYTSSDESILSFDNTNGTCTFHNTGMVYVTIVYQNVKPGGQIPNVTTTITIKVTN